MNKRKSTHSEDPRVTAARKAIARLNTPKESSVEAYLRKRIEAIGGKALKFTSPNQAGVTDRIVLVPHCEVWFVETKKRGKPMSGLQDAFAVWLDQNGFNHACLDSEGAVNMWLDLYILP